MHHTNCRRSHVTVALLLGLVLSLAAVAGAQTRTITLDPLDPATSALVKPLFGTPFYIGPDPNGDVVWIMGDATANSVPSDTYEMRYVLFDIDPVSEFTLELESRGWATGSANPSLFLLFGWQDYKNYYYVYPAESVETRVARVVDGRHETLYRHGSIIWYRNRQVYQSVRVEVKKIDGNTVVRTYVNGELMMVHSFAAGKEPPAGKLGLGMWNNAAHNSYFKNIKITVN